MYISSCKRVAYFCQLSAPFISEEALMVATMSDAPFALRLVDFPSLRRHWPRCHYHSYHHCCQRGFPASWVLALSGVDLRRVQHSCREWPTWAAWVDSCCDARRQACDFAWLCSSRLEYLWLQLQFLRQKGGLVPSSLGVDRGLEFGLWIRGWGTAPSPAFEWAVCSWLRDHRRSIVRCPSRSVSWSMGQICWCHSWLCTNRDRPRHRQHHSVSDTVCPDRDLRGSTWWPPSSAEDLASASSSMYLSIYLSIYLFTTCVEFVRLESRQTEITPRPLFPLESLVLFYSTAFEWIDLSIPGNALSEGQQHNFSMHEKTIWVCQKVGWFN